MATEDRAERRRAETADAQAASPAPEIAVIIPHLNQPDLLARGLEALMAQSRGVDGVELLVVDNGSRALPREVVARFPGVRLLQETTPGPGPARNLGVAESRAPLLAFIDADCVAAPNWLETIADAFAADPALGIAGGDVRILMEDPARPDALEAYEAVFAFRQEEYIRRQGFSGAGNMAVRREVFEAVGPFGGIDTAEDTDWGQRATRLGHSTRYLPEMLVRHPARRSMEELCRKWDRNISQHYRDRALANGLAGRLKWYAATAAMIGSPLGEIPRILASDRISGARERFHAFQVLARIRAYRARKMAAVVFDGATQTASASWNRE